MKKSIAIFLVFAFAVAFAQRLPVNNRLFLRTITSAFSNPVGIDYHEPTNSLITSVNYPNGANRVFERIEFDGSRFGFSIAVGLTDEIKIATVKSGPLKHPLANIGDFYTGNGREGEVTKISADGSVLLDGTSGRPLFSNVNPAANTNNGLMRGSLAVDETGVYGGDIVVCTTAGQVWRINQTGFPRFIGSASATDRGGTLRSSSHLEGLAIVPNDVNTYGGMAGKILVGAEGEGLLWMFSVNGTVEVFPIFDNNNNRINIEDIDIVKPNQNFFGINFGQGRLLGSDASFWVGLEGEILLSQEFFAPSPPRTGLYILRWDFQQNVPYAVAIEYDPASPVQNVNHWEHVTFSKSGVLEIPPPTPLCFLLRSGGRNFNFQPLQLPAAVSRPDTLYYNYQNFHSGFTTDVPPAASLSNKFSIWFYRDLRNQLSLVLHADSYQESPQTGGSLSIQIESQGLGNRVVPRVQDDGAAISGAPSGELADRYIWDQNQGEGTFTWTWGATTSDGVVMGPLPIGGLSRGFCFQFTILSATGINGIQLISQLPNSTTLVTTNLNVSETVDVCVYECDKFCFLFQDCKTCTPNSGCTWCEATQTCLQRSQQNTCNGTKFNDFCPCNFYNNADGCAACTRNPACGWCCLGGGSGACYNGTVGGPTGQGQVCNLNNWRYGGCTGTNDTCPGGCNLGRCECGVCICPLGYTGVNCEIPLGCDGLPASGEPPVVKTFDQCGVCGGNGTSCIGCDGTPFGPKFDACGVCGGLGNTCFDPCNLADCGSCVAIDFCAWCNDDSVAAGTRRCFGRNNPDTVCPAGVLVIDCSQTFIGLTVQQAAGLGAGIIAAIVIAIVVAVVLAAIAGKKGYDVWSRHRGMMSDAQANPLYQDGGRSGENALYTPKE